MRPPPGKWLLGAVEFRQPGERPCRLGDMEWFDFTWGPDDKPGLIVELRPHAPGLGLELHIYLHREGSLAVWVLEDGTELREAVVGEA
jgi:hypothetical protein